MLLFFHSFIFCYFYYQQKAFLKHLFICGPELRVKPHEIDRSRYSSCGPGRYCSWHHRVLGTLGSSPVQTSGLTGYGSIRGRCQWGLSCIYGIQQVSWMVWESGGWQGEARSCSQMTKANQGRNQCTPWGTCPQG